MVKHRVGVTGGKSQHGLVGHREAGLAGFLDGEHIVAQLPEFQHDREREVLVGVKAGHQSASSFARICWLISS